MQTIQTHIGPLSVGDRDDLNEFFDGKPFTADDLRDVGPLVVINFDDIGRLTVQTGGIVRKLEA